MKVPYLDFLKINSPIEDKINSEILSVVNSGVYINGPHKEAFEKEYAEYCNAVDCVGVGNGLDALTISLWALKNKNKWNESCEVIMPAHTFIATALSVMQAGLKPVLCDVDCSTHSLCLEQLKKTITSNTKVIVVVHLHGFMANLNELQNLCEAKGISLIEDAAQSHGAVFNNKKSPHYSALATFSFYPGKNLGAIGDGGAIVTNDVELGKSVRAISNYGSVTRYNHEFIGVNSRLDEIQAAFLSLRLKNLDIENNKRIETARLYSENIDNPQITLPVFYGNGQHVYHNYVLYCEERDELLRYLSKKEIDAIIHYPKSLNQHECFEHYNFGEFKNAEIIASQCLSIPIGPHLNEEQKSYVIEALNHFK
ncbi:DegT/DnrJ/EryC1/StrS family aminotransferase [Emcibacteraceae bacterium]|nr:DegT/DnrJ/EryC1/StrS family aminotransferase [Emcibacteraceae bacterium]